MNRIEALIQRTNDHIKWGNEIIIDYRKNGNFSPLDILMNKEDKQTKLFCLCAEYEHEIETALEEINARFEKRRNNLVYCGKE